MGYRTYWLSEVRQRQQQWYTGFINPFPLTWHIYVASRQMGLSGWKYAALGKHLTVIPSTVTVRYQMHTCNWELSDHMTPVTANHSSYMIRMPASTSWNLDPLKEQGGGGRKGLTLYIQFNFKLLWITSGLTVVHRIVPCTSFFHPYDCALREKCW